MPNVIVSTYGCCMAKLFIYFKVLELFPLVTYIENMYFRAANLDHGYWTTPYFDCNGKVPKWFITYAAPFFGWDSLKVKLEFK